MNIEAMMQGVSNSTFWQANFWGIVGSITGIAGLIVSWFSFRYNTPNIDVEELVLFVPKWIAEDWGNRELKQLEGSVLEFELEVVVRNKRGGSGSIRKPDLIVTTPLSKKWFLTKWHTFKLEPITEHFESEEMPGGNGAGQYYKTWTERHGRSFNLTGGERLDDKLTYHTYHKPELIKQYALNMSKAKYWIEFSDMHGKLRRIRITDIRNKRT